MSVTDWKYPTVIYQQITVWDDVTKMYSDNGTFATSSSTKNSAHINVFFEFTNTQVPSGATIDGIEVKYERYCNTATSKYESVLQFNLDTSQRYDANLHAKGSNYASATKWATSAEVITAGGASDLWGTTWSQADIVSPYLSIDMKAESAENSVAYIDFFAMRVYYTAGGGGSPVFLPNIMKHNFIPPMIGGF